MQNATSAATGLIVATGTEVQEVTDAFSLAFGLSSTIGQKLVAKHGVEIVSELVEIKRDQIEVSVHRFVMLVNLGFNAVEVHQVYNLRADLQDQFKDVSWHSMGGRISAFPLIQLARLNQRFQDFREFGLDEQFAMISRIVPIFKWTSFRQAVQSVIALADDLGIDMLENLLEITEDFASGDLFATYFADGMLEDIPPAAEDSEFRLRR